jgi:hypothetical protein
LLTTPPRPVPATSPTATPASAAARRAEGADFTSPVADGEAVVVGAAGAGAGAGEGAVDGAAAAAAGAAGAGAAGAAAVGADESGAGAPVPAGAALSSSSPRSWSTFTTSPSATAVDAMTPARGAGTSTVILSVSSSTIVSPLATESPCFFTQRETVASTIDSPSGGTLMDNISYGSKMGTQPISSAFRGRSGDRFSI